MPGPFLYLARPDTTSRTTHDDTACLARQALPRSYTSSSLHAMALQLGLQLLNRDGHCQAPSLHSPGTGHWNMSQTRAWGLTSPPWTTTGPEQRGSAINVGHVTSEPVGMCGRGTEKLESDPRLDALWTAARQNEAPRVPIFLRRGTSHRCQGQYTVSLDTAESTACDTCWQHFGACDTRCQA